MIQSEFVKLDVSDEIAIVTLDRQDSFNAWHSPMRKEVARAFRYCNAEPTVKAVVITGAGSKAFSAGQDLAEAQNFDSARAVEWMGEWRDMYGSIREMDKPVVAALNGVAAGSAFQVALLCDLRVGHAGSSMGQPEIDSGIPSTLGPWLMWDMLGRARTIELTLTGRMMDGAECHSLGLINHLVAEDEVLARAVQVARELSQKPPIAMMLNKRRFRELTDASFEEAEVAGERIQAEAFESGEPQAAMEAFFAERRARKESGS